MTARRVTPFRAAPCFMGLLAFGAVATSSCADTGRAPTGIAARSDGEVADGALDASVRHDAASTELDAASERLDAARTELDAASLRLDARLRQPDSSPQSRDVAWETDAAASSCAESSALELAVTYERGELSSASWYFSHPYGTPFLFLDGQGRYVMGIGNQSGIRQGQLSAGEVDALRASLHLTSLPSWPSLGPRGGGVTKTLVIRTRDATFSCNDCAAEGTPESAAVAAMMPELLARLAASTTPLGGPLCVAVLDRNLPQQPDDEPWPLAWSPTDVAVSADTQVDLKPFARTVVGDEANQLRARRDVRSAIAQYDVGSISIAYGGESFWVTMQGVLPDCLALAVSRWRYP
jgi:hypothetical protein